MTGRTARAARAFKRRMKSPSILMLPLLLGLSACAANEEQVSARAEAELSEELAGRTAGEPRNCISAATGRSLVVRDKRTLVYEEGGTIWVNRLEAACPSLDPFGQLRIDVQGSQYCRNDRIQGLEPGSAIPGPWCRLGSFTPYRRP